MIHFGLIGRKLGHSFSQKFFTAKFAADQVDADYALIEMESIEDIDEIITKHNLSGFNVTIPYKESIIPHLDELSPEAEAVGAVNCVVVKSGKKIGYNTDIVGVDASLEWLEMATATDCLILGTGGASKAVQYSLKRLGKVFHTVSRDAERGDYTYDSLTEDIIANHNVIINTTPVGMLPNVGTAPMICYDSIGSDHRLFDLVYNPANTLFLERGKARGAKTLGGMLMLQTQAIAAWHIWQRELEIKGA